jgi:threonine dehydratase
VPPYNDEALIAGQGTIGLEILQDLPEVETVLVPVGGGGLISGVAAALKLSRPEVRVIGVEPELAADAQASLRSGGIVEFTPEQVARTIADGLRTQHLSDITFAHIERFVDDIVTVSEEEIVDAMRKLAYEVRLVAEPSGAVAFAGYLYRRDELPSTRLNVAVVSGGNVEPRLLTKILTDER